MDKCPVCANTKAICLEIIPIEEEIEGREGKKFLVKVGFCPVCRCVYVFDIERRE